ncbi:hypothetical protein N7468_010819 [Penicillium chermesinum]|uniref:Beta-catenin-like protein 1 N-terminal domain-containing protein n=1 Tax=Penicillium chermesinum TaxID=63820 RepID=A0A9W9N8C6_9EURO|nr:uncharacterized protein N7468_010819 [Penicillium chermesinum]KAJ5215140.1 hypothetical protein N7468_010819 [Penicillium chermesinum]
MTSVDELFKKPTSSGSSKRKLEPVQNPNELYKSARLDGTSDAKHKARDARVEDDEEDAEAGPELPPSDDEDVPEDEEGRFFGGGARTEDHAGNAKEKFDTTWARRFAINFERKITKNAELRAKFENEPQKFMASEADLDTEIRGLSILSEHSDLYEEFSRLGCAGSLVSLLSHENADIAINAIQIISELTDEDVAAEQGQWDALVNAMMDADLIELLTQNLSRLDESSETDRSGVYYILSVLENLSSRTAVAERLGRDASVLPWIMGRIQQKETPVSQNKQYATEILAILLQSSNQNRARFIELDGIDVLLQLLSQYRKRDPVKDSNEEEYVENLFDAVVCLVDETPGKEKFVEAEGIELALIMLREGKFSKPRALRILDHAFSGPGGQSACERFVEAAGLRTAFGMFMKKQEHQSIEHLLGIFASLLRLLPGDSAPRIRLLAKFMEKDYEKVERLFKLRWEYVTRLSPVEKAIDDERQSLSPEDREMFAGEWLSRRFDAGLFSLQAIDVILAWLVAEDTGARKRVISILTDRGESLALLRATLQEQLGDLDDQEAGNQDLADMLNTLIQFL